MSTTVSAAPLFVGLHAYTEAQAASFFGRNDESDRLTNLIKAATLTIVFGKSGTGKTSLLNAGVFPRLRKEYCLPFRIRLEFADDSPDLVSQIKQTLKEEIDKYGFQVESYPGTETLWEYFHREQLWKSVTPILIFDQFEEIFTLAKKSSRFNRGELDAFWDVLADLIENSIPDELKPLFLAEAEEIDYSYKVQKIKILFSFREEFLPEFEGITARIPSLKYSRFRLLPMNGNQAHEVVTKTWKDSINAAEAGKVVRFFSSDDSNQPYELMTVEPSLLSQVCSLIEKERLREGKQKISAEFLDQHSKEFLLRSIYDEAMNESNKAIVATTPMPAGIRPVNEFAEDKLVTDEGYRTRYALAAGDEVLAPGIAVLKTKYFVREDGKSIELTHDVLTPLIKRDREERRKELAMVAARKKTRRRVMMITAVATLAALGLWYFTAGKAIEQKKEAIQKRDEAKKETEVLNVKLNTIDSTIKQRTEVLKAVETGRPGAADSVWRLQYIEQIRKDSLQLSALNLQLATQRMEWERKDSLLLMQARTQSSGTSATQRQFDSANRAAQAAQAAQGEIASLNNRLEQLQTKYDGLQAKYDDLLKTRQSPAPKEKANVPETVSKEPVFDAAAADTNSLKLTMFYNNAKRPVEKDLKIFLIPRTAANKSIIDKVNETPYDRRCDEGSMNQAKGGKRALYVGGTYVFFDVAPGSYFIKVCTPYGNNVNITKKDKGNMTTRVNVAPPMTD